MSKDPNLSDADRSSQTDGSKEAAFSDFGDQLNIDLAVRQHLRSLQDFGISVAARGRGESFPLPTAQSNPELAEPSNLVAEQAIQTRPGNKPAANLPTAATNASTSNAAAAKPVRAAEAVREPRAEPAAANANQISSVGLDTPYPAVEAGTDRVAQLSVIQAEVASCTRCPQLCEYRTNTVFGAGDPSSRLVFVGEGPGEQEDREGEPFVGAAGQLLNKILSACGLKREQVYILNTVKCRPPQNRNPKPDELSNCWSYGQRQLDILQPEFICCLGSVAAKTVLNTNLSVGKLRKKFHRYRGSKVLVTYHPAYLLRTSSAKIHAWNDMKMLMKEMGIEIPNTSGKG